MSSHLDDTGDWPFRESTPVRPHRELEPEPEAAASVAVQSQPEPEPQPETEPESPREPEEQIAAEAAPELAPEPEPEETGEPSEPEPGQPELQEEPEEEPQPEEAPPVADHAESQMDIPAGYTLLEGSPTGERRTVGIVVSRFNGEITSSLLENALAELDRAGVPREAVTVMPVPGAFELPLAAMALAKTRRYACVVALGCVIRGETPHFDFVAGEAASGLQLAAVETGVPVSFGLLTCETREQAEARVGKGTEAVQAALEMADLFARLRAQAAASR